MDENSLDRINEKVEESESIQKVGQEQIHGLLFGEKLSWQSIIYDLINTEQLDPWDIDISLLSNKYLEKVRELEEANLFVSSKVLFAASLLLRIKTEILLNEDIPGLDDILFGREEKKKYIQERMELDEDVPMLIQRTPLPRHRKVTLQQLMSALGKAVRTENRRIQKVITARQQEIETAIAIPKATINIGDSIKSVYRRLKEAFSKKEERVAFSEFVEKHNGGKKVEAFVPLLHLDNSHKVVLEQEGHLDEIYIWMKHWHNKTYEAELEKMRKEVELMDIEERLERDQEEDDNKEK